MCDLVPWTLLGFSSLPIQKIVYLAPLHENKKEMVQSFIVGGKMPKLPKFETKLAAVSYPNSQGLRPTSSECKCLHNCVNGPTTCN